MDIDEINRCLTQLDQGEMTYSNCTKIASLLIIREFYTPDLKSTKTHKLDQVERELFDIIPHYKKYCGVKREFQQHNLGKEPVLEALKFVCKEVSEFLQTLYSHTDMPEEREMLKNLVNNFTFL